MNVEYFKNMFSSVDDATHLRKILDQSKDLRDILPKFDKYRTVSILSGLLTFPELHANTSRVEAMIHLAVSICEGKCMPTKEDVQSWLNGSLGGTSLCYMEDPLEDVFVSNVINNFGNNRIFEGIWESSDFWLQALLTILRSLPRNPQYVLLNRSIRALLKMSEEVAQRSQLDRWTQGGGVEKDDLVIPEWEKLIEASGNVTFSSSDLRFMRVVAADLDPFIWDPANSVDLLNYQLENTPLERRPIIRHNGKYILSIPTSVCVAIKRLVLEVLDKNGDLLNFEYTLNQYLVHIMCEDVLSRFKADQVEGFSLPEVKWSKAPPASLTLIPFKFDTDKFGVVCLLVPKLHDALKLGFAYYREHSDSWDEIKQYLNEAMSQISKIPEFESGFLLTVVGGLGAPISLPKFDLLDNWYGAFYSAPNIVMASKAFRVDLLMLWRLSKKISNAEGRGLEIFCMNGDFNLLANWIQSDYQLIPDDFPVGKHGMFIPPLNTILYLRIQARVNHDVHASYRETRNCWVEVRRRGPYPTFCDVEDEPIYVSIPDLDRGILAGSVEVGSATFWMASDEQSKNHDAKSLIYQMWDCCCNWLLASVKRINQDYDFEDYTYTINLEFNDVSSWDLENKYSSEEPIVKILRTGDLEAVLTIGEDLFKCFNQHENIAERSIVNAIIQILSEFLELDIDQVAIGDFTDEIIPLGNARFFHVHYRNDAALNSTRGFDLVDFPREDVNNDMLQELGYALAPESCDSIISDSGRVKELVRLAVEKCDEDIAAILIPLNLKSVICRCLDAIESAHQDHSTWDLSAPALFALTKDKRRLKTAATDREFKRSSINIASRIIIETALFTCKEKDCKQISENNFYELVSLTLKQIEIAQHERALNSRLSGAIITIPKNGSFIIDNKELDEIRAAYISSSFLNVFEDSGQNYDRFFKERDVPDEPTQDYIHLNSSLVAEHGITCEEFYDVADFLNHYGCSIGKSNFTISLNELVALLAKHTQLSEKKAIRLLDEFTMLPRSGWNKDLPEGCKPRDTYPWLHKRKLSLVRKPFVAIDKNGGGQIVVSPLLVQQSFRHYIECSYRGWYPREFFNSLEMKEYMVAAEKRAANRLVDQTIIALNEAGYTTRKEVNMTELGADKKFGDVDVLAWASDSSRVFIIECKALQVARSNHEIISQLERFTGLEEHENDLLVKHLKRLQWLKSNSNNLSKLVDKKELELCAPLVTSNIVPMQFRPILRDREIQFYDFNAFTASLREEALKKGSNGH